MTKIIKQYTDRLLCTTTATHNGKKANTHNTTHTSLVNFSFRDDAFFFFMHAFIHSCLCLTFVSHFHALLFSFISRTTHHKHFFFCILHPTHTADAKDKKEKTGDIGYTRVQVKPPFFFLSALLPPPCTFFLLRISRTTS